MSLERIERGRERKNRLRDIFFHLLVSVFRREAYTGISTALAAVNEAASNFFSAGDKSPFECSAHGISNITQYFQP